MYKLKIERNSIKKVFSLTRSKTNLSILGAQKNIFFKLNFEFSFGHLFFEVKGRYVKILYKKCTFLRSLFESEKFAAYSPRACGQIRKNFGNWTHKIYLIGDIVPVFKNRKKFYITPPYILCTMKKWFTLHHL